MPSVLIRDVPANDLDQIRSAAAGQGTSLQSYLRDTVHMQAAYLRRREALARVAEQLRDRPGIPARERHAVLDAISEAHTQRAAQLNDRPLP